MKIAFPQDQLTNSRYSMGSLLTKPLFVSAFVIVIQEYIVQVLFDVSGNAPSGKSPDSQIMAHFLKLFPVFFLQFLAGNQFFQFSFGTKNILHLREWMVIVYGGSRVEQYSFTNKIMFFDWGG